MLQFSDSSSDLYSDDEDALYIKSLLPNVPVVYTLSGDGEKLISNTLPGSTDKDVVLYAGGGDEGMYTLTFTDASSLGNYNCVQLEDTKNGKWTVIREGSSYSFVLENKGQMNKFIVHYKSLPAGEECTVPADVATTEQPMSGIDIRPSQAGAQVIFNMPIAEDVNISVYNMLGEKVGKDIPCNAMDNTIQVPLPSSSAIYIINVQTPGGAVNKRIYR